MNCIGLGEIPGLQGSPMCKKHQEGFLEEAVGGIEAGLVDAGKGLPSRRARHAPFLRTESSRRLDSRVIALRPQARRVTVNWL